MAGYVMSFAVRAVLAWSYNWIYTSRPPPSFYVGITITRLHMHWSSSLNELLGTMGGKTQTNIS